MESRTLTASDLWQMSRVGQPEPAGDGSWAIVPVTSYDIEDNEGITRLWRVWADGSNRPLTNPDASSTAPALAPDGDAVAFMRKPQGADKPQLHIMKIDGGEAECFTDLPLGVSAARWLPDGTGLILAVPLLRGFPSVAATDEELDRREDAPTEPVVTEDRIYRYWKRWLVGGEIHHLFHLDLPSGELTDLTPELDDLISVDDPAGVFDVSPDGAEVAFAADVSGESHERFVFAIHTVGLDATPPRQITSNPLLPAQQLRPRYSPDGRYLTYGAQREPDYYAAHVELVRRDRESGEEVILAPQWDRSAGGWEYTGDGDLVLHTTHEGSMAVFLLPAGAASPTQLTTHLHAHGPRPTTGPVWLRVESPELPVEVATLDESGVRRVGSFNQAALDELDLGGIGEFTFSGADGALVQAHIVYPPGFDRSKRWPLVHNIHGGPHNASGGSWHWRWNTQAFAAAGYVVVSVNFHGSDSFGDHFTQSIRGAWGDKPAADILAATDHLIGQGFIDESRMAIVGGSYGGYLVSWLVGQTDRFAAAICHAGVTDLLGQWASDITAGRETSIGGVPWEDMDAVQRWSPLAHTHNMVTPTLVIHGELDYRVVVTQGLTLYGILKHKGVDSRLIYYPDEGHWIEKPRNSIHWYGEFMDWLERYIGRGPST
ncbi:MAG: S9 family peptidase [Acidimicrobiia bacterium]|nr:S9 family peptidase [Acidimicrobiia bacterium]